MVKATVAAIIEKNGRILLTKRSVEPYNGRWVLPGGHIDEFEKAADAVRREIKEETALDIEPEFLFYHDKIFSELGSGFDRQDVVLVFHCEKYDTWWNQRFHLYRQIKDLPCTMTLKSYFSLEMLRDTMGFNP